MDVLAFMSSKYGSADRLLPGGCTRSIMAELPFCSLSGSEHAPDRSLSIT